jgi:uncharacterized protein with ATP-grasp and redox domains
MTDPVPTPCLPLPEPITGAVPGSFAHRTVTVRYPAIARRVIADNSAPISDRPLPPGAIAGLETLLAEIPAGPIRAIHDPGAPDEADWKRYCAPYLGQDWLEVPWLFNETYFYRRILEASGYFQPGPGRGLDPFRLQKRLALEACGPVLEADIIRLGEEPLDPAALAGLFHLNLWGNQADLSMAALWQGKTLAGYQDLEAQAAHLLMDESRAAAEALLAAPPARVDFIPDNVGLELVFDLLLAGALLEGGAAGSVVFHLKAHPTFVSDAVVADVLETIAALSGRAEAGARALGERLEAALADRRLRLQSHYYWNSPLPAWEMPPELRADLSGSSLLIYKGDANYRRLTGDRNWPFETPFASIACYLPASLLALRVFKAELAAGLPPGAAGRAAAQDPDWLFSGRWGGIQFVRGERD